MIDTIPAESVESDDRCSQQTDPHEKDALIRSLKITRRNVSDNYVFFTPTGEGAIYMTDRTNQSFSNALKAVFTNRTCGLFDLNKSVVYTLPRPKIGDYHGLSDYLNFKGSPIMNLQSTIDLGLNPLIRIRVNDT
ncbi:hypothetical protein FBUS_10829 [Fasciolopsis buskii]|uniref:Uncharacterized protein n=1 Tax=Fasciolopsis buskii TaxID=27845 RepID=A0A8E0S1I4_9TREM|nr:hypothetical protein FBUS_10829 [Fasciolopsis buski]